MTVDVITVGNALVDLLVSLPDDVSSCRIDSQTHELCLKIGEKILADRVGFTVGGGACRVAIGLSRLGFKAGIFAEIGNDELATRIRRTLEEEKVNVERLISGQEMTSFTVGINYHKDRTLFIHHQKGAHEFHFDSLSAKWLYIASLGEPWVDVYQKAIAYKKQTGARIAFNPGPAQLKGDKELYMPLIESADVLFVNKEEAGVIAKIDTLDVKNLLKSLQKLGVNIVVITDGKNGSYSIDEEGNCLSMEIIDRVVVERTGAGDAYATGFISALMKGKTIEEAMRYGTCSAGMVVTEFGGVSGLLINEKMELMLKAVEKDLIAKVL